MHLHNLDRELTQITRPDAQAVSLGYDAGGRISTTTTPRGAVGYAYDATKGTLISITSPDGATLTYAYDGFLPTGETWSGAVSGSMSWTYDNDFRVTQVEGEQHERGELHLRRRRSAHGGGQSHPRP